MTNAGDRISTQPTKWQFNQNVAENFNAHVLKSVPYYLETEQLAVSLSDWFVSDGSVVVDIGCATGTTIGDLVRRHAGKHFHVHGIDNSAAMLEEARKNLKGFARVDLHCDDALNFNYPEGTGLIFALYTLQFVNPQKRPLLCEKLYKSLNRRGALIIAEKVLDDDALFTDIFIQQHWCKKEQMGFDVTEIYNKAAALRGVMSPFTLRENVQMLRSVGFERVTVFFKWCNFMGLIAVKA